MENKTQNIIVKENKTIILNEYEREKSGGTKSSNTITKEHKFTIPLFNNNYEMAICLSKKFQDNYIDNNGFFTKYIYDINSSKYYFITREKEDYFCGDTFIPLYKTLILEVRNNEWFASISYQN
jgi:hypothetical protein